VDDILAIHLPDDKPAPVAAPVLSAADTKIPASSDTLAAALSDILGRGPAVSGVAESRDTKTYAMACRLVNDWALTEAEAWPLIVAWNQTCRPPADESVLRTKLANAASYASETKGEARARYQDSKDTDEVMDLMRSGTEPTGPTIISTENPKPTFEVEIVKAQRELAVVLGTPTKGNSQLPLFQPATDYLSKPATPVNWLIRGLVIEGGVGAIIGEPKSTKSWMALDMALAVASGTKALSEYQAPHARKAAYFFAEDLQDAVTTRIRAYARGRGADASELARNLYVQPRGENVDLSKDADCARIIASCRMFTTDLGLLVLDPLRDIHTGSENESDSMAAVMKRLRALSTILKCTVLVVHHSKKADPANTSSNGNEIRGSSVINAALDSRLILKDLDGDRQTVFESTLEVVIKAGRGAGTPRILLTLEDDPETSQAVNAVWQVKPPAKEIPKSNDIQTEYFAYDLLRFLYTCDQRCVVPSYRATRTATSQTSAQLAAAKQWAVDRGWLVQEVGQFKLTESGVEQARLTSRRGANYDETEDS
jgi:hypothetical protein